MLESPLKIDTPINCSVCYVLSVCKLNSVISVPSAPRRLRFAATRKTIAANFTDKEHNIENFDLKRINFGITQHFAAALLTVPGFSFLFRASPRCYSDRRENSLT